jgi:hypothetical protein
MIFCLLLGRYGTELGRTELFVARRTLLKSLNLLAHQYPGSLPYWHLDLSPVAVPIKPLGCDTLAAVVVPDGSTFRHRACATSTLKDRASSASCAAATHNRTRISPASRSFANPVHFSSDRFNNGWCS